LDYLNHAKDYLAGLISQRDKRGNYFIVPDMDDLIADQREYALADDTLWHVFSVECAFTNTPDSLGNLAYILGVPTDFSKFGVSRTEANIRSYFANNFLNFGYEIQRRAIYILSGAIDSVTIGGATVPNGIRIRYRAYPADLTQLTDDTVDLSVDPTTTTFGFPKPFHELWAQRASMDWKSDNPGAVPPSALDASFVVDLEAALEGLDNSDMSREIFGTVPGIGSAPDPMGYDHGFQL
jgi:hypothetical protein